MWCSSIDPEGWASTMLENGTEQSYIDTMSASAPSWLLAVIIVGTLVIAAFERVGRRQDAEEAVREAGSHRMPAEHPRSADSGWTQERRSCCSCFASFLL